MLVWPSHGAAIKGVQDLIGMQLTDSNPRTRLHSCFEMRCHSAHPGEAPITEYNLWSFFSDLEQIIFQNPKFALPAVSQMNPQSQSNRFR